MGFHIFKLKKKVRETVKAIKKKDEQVGLI